MGGAQTIENEALSDLLELFKNERIQGVMSYLCKGKWHTADIAICTLTNKNMQIEILHGESCSADNISIDQPVGIVFQREYNKYIIDKILFD